MDAGEGGLAFVVRMLPPKPQDGSRVGSSNPVPVTRPGAWRTIAPRQPPPRVVVRPNLAERCDAEAHLVLILLIVGLTAVLAHHKPRHPMPQGQMRKFQDPFEAPVTVAPAENPPGNWLAHLTWMNAYDFEIALPLSVFALDEEAGRGLFLREVGGQGEMKVYGADNTSGRSPREFVTALEEADRIEEVTYRAEGRNWFVLSGYYADEDSLGEPLIFYAKVMFSADWSRVSAFEISYPQGEKRRFDPIVDRIENSLTPPT